MDLDENEIDKAKQQQGIGKKETLWEVLQHAS